MIEERKHILSDAIYTAKDDAVVEAYSQWVDDINGSDTPFTPMDKLEEYYKDNLVDLKSIEHFDKYDYYFYTHNGLLNTTDAPKYTAENTYVFDGFIEHYASEDTSEDEFERMVAILQGKQYVPMKERRYKECKDFMDKKVDLYKFVAWYNNYLKKTNSTEVPMIELNRQNWEEAVDKYNISAKSVGCFCDWHSHFYSVNGLILSIDGDNQPWELYYEEFVKCAEWYAETPERHKESMTILGAIKPEEPKPVVLKKYSFFSSEYSNCNQDEMREFMKTTNKQFVYTYGLSYRKPTTYRKPITKEEALNYFTKLGMIDVTEEDECVHVEEFSENDMW